MNANAENVTILIILEIVACLLFGWSITHKVLFSIGSKTKLAEHIPINDKEDKGKKFFNAGDIEFYHNDEMLAY